MKLARVRLVNYRQHADTDIEFETGLTGIVGPNGSGKTTILEAIAWALYGNPAARGTRDTIRFIRAPARAPVRVDLEFELGGHRYRVVRGLNTAELYLDGAVAPIAETLGGVTEYLQRRIGMTRAEFFNTYFTGQKELNAMAAMKPLDRAQFLSRVLGYEKLRAAQELARERRRLVVAEIAGLRSGMRDPAVAERSLADARARVVECAARVRAAEQAHAEAVAALASLAPRWVEVQEKRERMHGLLAEVRVAESEAGGLARDAERLARDTADIDAARAELEILAVALAPLEEIGREFHRLEDLAREEGKRATLQTSARDLIEELARLHERLEKVDRAPELEEGVTAELERARAELQRVEGELEARRTDWVRDRQEAETKRQTLRTQWTELREQRDRLIAAGENGTCPICQRPLESHFRAVLDELDSQIQTVEVDGQYYKQRIDQLEAMPQDIAALDERKRALFADVGAQERKLAKVQSAVQERVQLVRDTDAKRKRLEAVHDELAAIPSGYDANRHHELRLEVERLLPLDQRAARVSTLIEREPQLREERERVANAERDLHARLDRLRERRESLAFSDAEFATVRDAHLAAVGALQTAEVSLATGRSEVAGADRGVAAAEEARREMEESERKLHALVSEKRLHDELDRALADLRTELNAQLRPELSEIASDLLLELTDSRMTELELDDEYNIMVLEEGIPKPVISGGEEDVANLVLRLAISQMIAERAGQSFSLLILDEVFGSLDDARRQGVLHMLHRLQDRFEQVIVITHIESVREGLDHVIGVRYDEATGSSRVERQSPAQIEFDPSDHPDELMIAEAGD